MTSNGRAAPAPSAPPPLRPATSHTRRNAALLVTVLLAAAAIVGVVWASRPASAPHADAAANGCVVTAELVNPCRPWLGATANDYPDVGPSTLDQIQAHEKRIGRHVDIAHTYHGVGSNSLTSADRYFAERPDTILFTNWKPAKKWKDADGSDAATTAGIDEMARSIKALGDHKIMLTVAHEPENDLRSDPNCPDVTYRGHAGTPQQYRAMWRFVEQRFDALGVHNVVWVMDYINIQSFDCVVPDVWPGNDLVDWVMFDAYPGFSPDFVANVQRFEKVLTNDTDAAHAFTSKPWGIAEWGMSTNNDAVQRSYIDQARAALDENVLPRIKAYIVFDSNSGGGETVSAHNNLRVGFDNNGRVDPQKQQAYNAFANDPRISGSFVLPAGS